MPSAAPDFQIVDATLERVIPLRVEFLFAGERSPDQVTDAMDETARHWVAVVDGRDVACSTLANDPRLVAGQYAEHRLRYLGVDPALRGAGIGTALIAHRLHRVIDAGGKWAWTSARVSAAPMYVGLGATPDTHTYLDDGTITHVDCLYGPLPAAIDLIERKRSTFISTSG